MSPAELLPSWVVSGIAWAALAIGLVALAVVVLGVLVLLLWASGMCAARITQHAGAWSLFLRFVDWKRGHKPHPDIAEHVEKVRDAERRAESAEWHLKELRQEAVWAWEQLETWMEKPLHLRNAAERARMMLARGLDSHGGHWRKQDACPHRGGSVRPAKDGGSEIECSTCGFVQPYRPAQ